MSGESAHQSNHHSLSLSLSLPAGCPMRSARHHRPVVGSPYSHATALCLVRKRRGHRSVGSSIIIIGVGAAAEADDDDEEETTGWDEWEACGTRGETTRVFDDDGDQAEEEEEEEEEAAAADEDEDGDEALIIFLGEFPSCCGL